MSDAIGAFVIGLVLGATRFRSRIEQFALPLRDVFGAFFFLNFGLALDISTFGEVIAPVIGAVVMTLLVNALGGQLIARLNGFTPAQGLSVSGMLQNRGEFALILATLATAAGLDPRIVPFAGLYVLIMAVVGPILAVNSEKIGAAVFRPKPLSAGAVEAERDRSREREEGIALVEAALAGSVPSERETVSLEPEVDHEFDEVDEAARQAALQSDEQSGRRRDPEY